ncbi:MULTISPECIES: molybdopterin-dependent oxidoreductase [Streptomyces]|uniref:molybdopterin-dependent oxidoreductase n=1 Tax=Streptomyces TaxID=1883 RepID=UPI0022AFA319|nr:molybdopterin-dependent oxidoreductase [Streptomyces sp. H39-C1]MCZ4103724.1 molybdopterin-dependent oxidoreductase [Streptomyces sp. H39-C1]
MQNPSDGERPPKPPSPRSDPPKSSQGSAPSTPPGPGAPPSRPPVPPRARLALPDPPAWLRRGPLREGAFTGRLHDARTATVVGRALGAAIAVCFVTGLVSHYLQHPPDWAADRLPSRPSWGYRLTQGLHVATGIAAIPLLFAKLWTVYPRLFAWPPARSVGKALERLSIAVLVGTVLLQLLTGLLNTLQWYPWPWNFVPVHWALAWVAIGALLLHLAVKAPVIAAHWSRRSGGTVELPAADGPDRRAFVLGVGAAVGAVTLTTVGQSFTPLKDFDLLAPRHPDHGPQGLPVNKTAAAAGITAARLADWRLRVAGPNPYELTLPELRALEQHASLLPIACVEGWSKSAHWEGVRVRDLLDRAGAPRGARIRVVSLQQGGAYSVMEMGATYARDPLTLLALTLNGAPLSVDHGFPARIIAPNRPGVLQTKWVSRLEVLA